MPQLDIGEVFIGIVVEAFDLAAKLAQHEIQSLDLERLNIVDDEEALDLAEEGADHWGAVPKNPPEPTKVYIPRYAMTNLLPLSYLKAISNTK